MTSSIPVDDTHSGNSLCRRRREHVLALIEAVENEGRGRFGPTVVQCSLLEPGCRLRLSDQPADSTLIVRRGLIERMLWMPSDTAVAGGFYDDGSIIDLSLQLPVNWGETLIAIEQSRVCRFRASVLPMAVRREFAALVSVQLGKEHDFQLKLLEWSVEQRVAAFLLRRRAHSRGEHLSLSMPDASIASYLGIGGGELRAALRYFDACGWIAANERQVILTDGDALTRLTLA